MDKRSIFFVLALVVALFFVNRYFNSSNQPVVEKPIARGQSTQLQEFPEANHQMLDNERFYVLENEYQQLVFSTIGGALAEINLALQSEEHPNSVVREIEFDRIMKKDYAQNDYFPLFPHQIASPTPHDVTRGKLGGYYPLLRRTIMGPSYHITNHIPPSYYALNVIPDQGNANEIFYQVKRFEKNLIEFESVQSNRRITKTFSFPNIDAPYCFDLKVKVEGDARGLSLTSGVPEVELISGSATPAIKYRVTHQNKADVEQIDLPKTSSVFSSIYPDWICDSNGFFGIISDPMTEVGPGFTAHMIPGNIVPTRISLIDSAHDLYPAKSYPGYETRIPLSVSNNEVNFRIFAGPFDSELLKKVDNVFSDPVTGYNPDYAASQSFHGWFSFISEPFAKFLFFLMKLFYRLTHSWGFSIILLTVALRIMLYPLNAWSIKSTSRMQQVAPQVAAIQEKFKKDPKRSQLEIMTLYREKGVNPFTGCFPVLIQIPFLIGMFDLLKSTFELRGASFIPGWIDNLTAPDVVFTWNYPIFFFGNSFHLLPILLGLVMYLQQKFSSPLPKGGNQPLTDQQKQQKMMGNIMVIVFAVMFYKFPSGLNIYWLSSMLLGILQQWFMTRKLPKPEIVVRNK